jgi:hypothetical protein
MEEVEKYEIEVEITSPILQHKFNGKDEEKANKEKSDKEQAEYHAYRTENGNMGIPSTWIKGCLREYIVAHAGSKQKRSTLLEISPRIQVQPYMIDLGTKVYKIDKRAIPVKIQGKISDMDFCIRPLIEKAKFTFVLVSTLSKTEDEWKSIIEGAGIDTGIGSNTVNGYGRFKVLSITKV